MAVSDPDTEHSVGQPVARHSRRFSDALVEEARELFQKESTKPFSNEDARQMLENLTGFFTLLLELDRRSARRANAGENNTTGPETLVDPE